MVSGPPLIASAASWESLRLTAASSSRAGAAPRSCACAASADQPGRARPASRRQHQAVTRPSGAHGQPAERRPAARDDGIPSGALLGGVEAAAEVRPDTLGRDVAERRGDDDLLAIEAAGPSRLTMSRAWAVSADVEFLVCGFSCGGHLASSSGWSVRVAQSPSAPAAPGEPAVGVPAVWAASMYCPGWAP